LCVLFSIAVTFINIAGYLRGRAGKNVGTWGKCNSFLTILNCKITKEPCKPQAMQ